MSFCAHSNIYSTNASTVTYDRVNLQTNPYYTGGLDKATGKFTSPTSAVFSVSFFFSADNNKGSGATPAITNNLYIQKNDRNLPGGRIFSTKFSSVNGSDDDSSGKSLLLKLEKADTVSVFLTSGELHFVSFCVHKIG